MKTISPGGTVNSDPVISETGLAAWMLYETNAIRSEYSHIGIYVDDQFRNLTEDAVTFLYGAAKPVVQSNAVVFLASGKNWKAGDETWVLSEVSDRDEGDFPELDARFIATVDEFGEKRLIAVNPPNTNETTEADSGSSTNAARRLPSGEAEVWYWSTTSGDINRITQDSRNDFSAHFWGDTIAWQKAKGWPFGWEIMALIGDTRVQLTTNFYYDMGPQVQGSKIVWYGWDGFDYEIFMNDTITGETIQITSNRYDDVAPMVWNNVVVWEGYPAVESDIFLWKDGEIKNISNNIDDDLSPRIWGNKVVWQGFDGDDFEIYLHDIDKGETIQVTGNRYDDTNPEIADDFLVWMGYEGNWDAEIYYLDTRNLNVGDIKPVQLTENEEDDRDPQTAARRIVWVAEEQGETSIKLAEPR